MIAHQHRLLAVLAALALLAAGVALAEVAGWPFLAGPAERLLSSRLQRAVTFTADEGPRLQVRLIGGIRLQSARFTIGPAAWGGEQPLMVARHVDLQTTWADVWALRDGPPLRLRQLGAQSLALDLQRHADGRVNWRFATGTEQAAEALPPSPVTVDTLRVGQGRFKIQDDVLKLVADGSFGSVPGAGQTVAGWTAQASGSYRGQPLRAQARAGAELAGVAQGDAQGRLPLTISVDAGRARLQFDGTLRGGAAGAWDGRFNLAGPSLAAVGAPLGLTLPTTAAFSMAGRLQHEAGRSVVAVAQARIGRSDLAGDFTYDGRAMPRPRLSGELRGRALWLQDLGPAVGTAPTAAPAPGDRVLPNRALDVPSLGRMDADVGVRLDRLELGHPRLQSISPLRAQLTMKDGVLRIGDLDARLAQGRIGGHVQLDGRADPARWTLDLTARGLRLEQWIVQSRPGGAPPYVSGRLAGRVQLEGRGRSTAQWLASSNGQAWLVLTRGQISHLAVEAAGLDLAQALGVALRGDDALPVTCGAADLQVRAGQVRPQVLLLDTRDSTLWAEGSLSLADEQMDLTLKVMPKDFSPLSLRAPLHVQGPLAAPQVSIDKGPLLRRVVPAALLAMLNPLAGLLPLLDLGDDDSASQGIDACRQVLARRTAPT